jgi:hypothetical protein
LERIKLKVNIKEFERKAAAVSSLVDDVRNQLPDSEIAEFLENDYSILHSMILNVIETLDCVLSDVEK